ncbi:hypothetical protein TetV_025 [Tetraselmis virus 1]|uniref:Uncharacterized protein n=1 Tax=Tetraselmis virus 1 TaxID=2060617 RepID=A0A2P0VMJ9_9VIRU|nr:hypothetical protein QJ968_gp025 [Tetraselmis virus 1]AUF82117.1 hypothetical protein TetV_025 [Tetraselmis virus 1]
MKYYMIALVTVLILGGIVISVWIIQNQLSGGTSYSSQPLSKEPTDSTYRNAIDGMVRKSIDCVSDDNQCNVLADEVRSYCAFASDNSWTKEQYEWLCHSGSKIAASVADVRDKIKHKQ